MDPATLKALAAFAVVGICTAPACLAVGVVLGAWIQHRAQRHASPVPDLAAGVKSIIASVRTKPRKEPKVHFPRQKA